MKPFNLKEALAGKPVQLSDGTKAYVRHHEKELNVENNWQLQGISEDGQLYAWTVDGCLLGDYTADIVGMWQETQTISGFEVPTPVSTELDEDTDYYKASPTHEYFYSSETWTGHYIDKLWLKRGLVFLSKEDAIANAKAMLGIDPNVGEDE